MNGHELAVVQGWADTRATLREWNAAPVAVLWRWVAVSLGISLVLLAAVLFVGTQTPPWTGRRLLPGVNAPAGWHDVAVVAFRNSLVLALHAMACLAGFIAKSSLPIEAAGYRGAWRKVHDVAGPAAMAFVTLALLFSFTAQALVLGEALSGVAWQLGMTPASLLAAISIHAVPELCAVFLPLAAWLIAARAGRWEQLMAATIVTTVIAAPVIVIAAMLEVFVTPHLLV